MMADTKRKQPEPNTTIGSIIKEATYEKGMMQSKLAEALGYKAQSGLSERLRGDMRVSVVIRILDALGYELVVRDKGDAAREWVVKEL